MPSAPATRERVAPGELQGDELSSGSKVKNFCSANKLVPWLTWTSFASIAGLSVNSEHSLSIIQEIAVKLLLLILIGCLLLVPYLYWRSSKRSGAPLVQDTLMAVSTEDEPEVPAGLDTERIQMVRTLVDEEAHLRAAAALDDYKAELRNHGKAALVDALESYCCQSVHFRRSRYKEQFTRRVLEGLEVGDISLDGEISQQDEQPKGWSWKGQGAGGSELFSRRDPDGLDVMRMRGKFSHECFKLFAIFYEVDLYHTWLPFVWEAKRLHVIEGGGGKYAQFLLLMRFVFPWPIWNREALFFCMGCEALEHRKMVLVTHNVPENADEWWGCKIPKPERAVRMKGTVLAIVEPGDAQAESTILDAVIKMDPRIGWIPQSVSNAIGRHFVKLLFYTLGRAAKNYDRGPYPSRVERNERGVYSFLKRGLNAFITGSIPIVGDSGSQALEK